MTSRLVLLAPGDVIGSVVDKLRERDIDIKVKDAPLHETDTTTAGDRQEREPGVRAPTRSAGSDMDSGAARSAEPPREETARDGVGSDVHNSTRRSDTSSGDRVNRSGATDPEARSAARGRGDRRETEKSMENPASSNTVARESEAHGPGRVFVSTPGLREALRRRGYTDTQVYGTDAFSPDRDRLILFGSAPLKELGVRQDEGAAQKDAESRLRREKVRNPIEVERIHSVQRLNEEFPAKAMSTRKAVPVALVTNDMKFVPQAHILFTAPTGDPTWKKTAREATKKKEIRAYAHNDADVAAGEALITLIDAL
ncbi:Hel [Muko virus]|uniref:Hel n=1 Tax=Muko virus TaxID=1597962 RepID=A0A0P0YK95_9REOV|nr:Hel [Muko virus]